MPQGIFDLRSAYRIAMGFEDTPFSRLIGSGKSIHSLESKLFYGCAPITILGLRFAFREEVLFKRPHASSTKEIQRQFYMLFVTTLILNRCGINWGSSLQTISFEKAAYKTGFHLMGSQTVIFSLRVPHGKLFSLLQFGIFG